MNKIELLTLTDDVLDKKVKIQGTKYDRKRTISDEVINKMLKMVKKKDYAEIAKNLGLSVRDVRYHTDPIYRAEYLSKLSGKHTGKDHITMKDRVAYKRKLVAAGKIGA